MRSRTLHDGLHRRQLDPRREPRSFRQRCHRGDRGHLHVLGGVNFSLHFLAWRHRRLANYFRDPEFSIFARILVVSIVALHARAVADAAMRTSPAHALRLALFHAVSMQTTSGFVTDNFSLWPGALPVILMLSRFHRRLRRLDFRRHEGRALAAHVEAGSARGRAAGAPERRAAGEARATNRSTCASSMRCGDFFAVYVVLVRRPDGRR